MNKVASSQYRYDLVFEGASDPSVDTAWEIKFIFMSELGFDVQRAKRLFDQAPSVLHSAAATEELARMIPRLQRAGADVRIVARLPQRESVAEPSKVKPRVQHEASQTIAAQEAKSDLNDFFNDLTRSRAINTKLFKVVDGVEKRESTGEPCRRELQS